MLVYMNCNVEPLSIAENQDKYGEVCTLHVDIPIVVVLNSSEAVYEGFTKNADHMSVRPMNLNPVYRLTGGRLSSH